MLEYLKGNFRQHFNTFAIDPHTRRVNLVGHRLSFPAVALCQRLYDSYTYIYCSTGCHGCEVHILCADGLEYCWCGNVMGSGVIHLADYLL